MTEDFEFRDDPIRAKTVAGNPKQVCALKFQALKACADYVRVQAITGSNSKARQLADLLDQVGITPDFVPDDVAA
jgi:hypothetical protein